MFKTLREEYINRVRNYKQQTEMKNAITKMKNTLEGNNSDLRTESEGWKKIFHTNVNDKKAEVVILISDDADFKTVYNKRQRGVSCNDTGINSKKMLAFVNIYTLIIGVPKYIQQILTDLKIEIDIM